MSLGYDMLKPTNSGDFFFPQLPNVVSFERGKATCFVRLLVRHVMSRSQKGAQSKPHALKPI
jgi:hypothetical protein